MTTIPTTITTTQYLLTEIRRRIIKKKKIDKIPTITKVRNEQTREYTKRSERKGVFTVCKRQEAGQVEIISVVSTISFLFFLQFNFYFIFHFVLFAILPKLRRSVLKSTVKSRYFFFCRNKEEKQADNMKC